MSRVKYVFAILVAVGLTVSGTVIQGHYTGRWRPETALTEAGRRLATVPDRCGPWRVLATSNWDQRLQQTLACTGYIQRTYEHANTGRTAEVAIFIGPTGPTVAHTPEICYSSRNYDIEGKPQRITISRGGGTSDEFWGTTFRSLDPGMGPLLVGYAWSEGGPWMAPDHPRLALGGRRMLYKLQVAISLPAGATPGTEDPRKTFLSALLPTVAPALVRTDSL